MKKNSGRVVTLPEFCDIMSISKIDQWEGRKGYEV